MVRGVVRPAGDEGEGAGRALVGADGEGVSVGLACGGDDPRAGSTKEFTRDGGV